jgi:hypothetical protein
MKERKTRKAETRRYEVRWIQHDMIYMRWFCRSNAAKNLASELQRQGYETIVVRW